MKTLQTYNLTYWCIIFDNDQVLYWGLCLVFLADKYHYIQVRTETISSKSTTVSLFLTYCHTPNAHLLQLVMKIL